MGEGFGAIQQNKRKMEVKVQVQKYKTRRKSKIQIFVGPLESRSHMKDGKNSLRESK